MDSTSEQTKVADRLVGRDHVFIDYEDVAELLGLEGQPRSMWIDYATERLHIMMEWPGDIMESPGYFYGHSRPGIEIPARQLRRPGL